MKKTVNIGIVQTKMGQDQSANIANTCDRIRQAASLGAQVVLPPELFENRYFPQEEQEAYFSLAAPAHNHPTLERMSDLAAELRIALVVSFFEHDAPHYYNSVAVLDADGRNTGIYRKSHIPTGPGYEEKFYFKPGDSGFRVFDTAYAKLGVGICWDQWFPETARELMLRGAELLLYPSAIGSEPGAPGLNTQPAWQRVMQGHAVANMVPVAASNRIGSETKVKFFGSSFICDHFGEVIKKLPTDEENVSVATLDLTQAEIDRASFGFFRDRRVELYSKLCAKAGS